MAQQTLERIQCPSETNEYLRHFHEADRGHIGLLADVALRHAGGILVVRSALHDATFSPYTSLRELQTHQENDRPSVRRSALEAAIPLAKSNIHYRLPRLSTAEESRLKSTSAPYRAAVQEWLNKPSERARFARMGVEKIAAILDATTARPMLPRD